MVFSPKVIARFEALGATVDPTADTLEKAMLGLKFRPYPNGEGELCRNFTEFLEENEANIIKDDFELARRICRYVSVAFCIRLFTGFHPGTADYEEWHDPNLENFRQTTFPEYEKPTLIILGWKNSQFTSFVIAEDPHPENPTVYTMDDDLYLSEIDYTDTLLEWLEKIATDTEFTEELEEYFRDLKE